MAEPAHGAPLVLCQACRRLGGCRLGMTSERLEEPGRSISEIVCGPEFEGGPGVAHGGWTAEVMDETLGHLNLLEGRLAVTATLTVDYRKPVPIGRPLIVRAWREAEIDGRVHNRGEMVLASTGAVLARAHGRFALRDRSHFDRHRQWLERQDDIAAPTA